MKKLKVYQCVIDEKTPIGTISWKAIFLQPPTEEQVREVLRDAIAEESRLSQEAPYKLKKQIGEQIIKGAKLKRREVIAAMQFHIAGLSWIVRQHNLTFRLLQEEVWDNHDT